MPARFSIAHVTPYPWEEANNEVTFARLDLMDSGIAARGVVYGREIEWSAYLGIFDAVLSAAGWATRVGGLSNLKVPIAVIIFPSTAIIMGGLEGQTFTFKEIGNLFAQSFSLALEHAVNALDAFQESVGGIFR